MRLGINVQVLEGHTLSFVKQAMYVMKKVPQFPLNAAPVDTFVKREPQLTTQQVYLEYHPRLVELEAFALKGLLQTLHLHGYPAMSWLPLLLNHVRRGIFVLQTLQLHWVVVNV